MKVKRLRDGKIVEVEKHGDALIAENGKVMYFDEVCEVDEPDWQHYHIQAAIAAMQTIADALGSVDYNKELIAKHAVELADALVEELKKGGEQ